MIYTFYSFKGGVGRSMALANIAECFYEKGLRVLAVDWDLEAPGLENYFYARLSRNAPHPEFGAVKTHPGLLDMLRSYQSAFPDIIRSAPGFLRAGLVPPWPEPRPGAEAERGRPVPAVGAAVSAAGGEPDDRAERAEQMKRAAAIAKEFLAKLDLPEELRQVEVPSFHGSPPSERKTFATLLDESLCPVDDYLYMVHSSGQASLRLLTAGGGREKAFAKYAEAVQDFDWLKFYAAFEGKQYFDWLYAKLNGLADVVLIDSRTGVTEMGGVCTRQMADAVVAFCAPNFQNVDGVVRVVTALESPTVKLARDDRDLHLLVIPTRIDNSESGLLGEFSDSFGAEVEVRDRVPPVLRSITRPMWNLRIPYVPRYNYEERLVVGPGETPSDPPSLELAAAYRKIAAHLAAVAPDGSNVFQSFASEIALHIPQLRPQIVISCAGGSSESARLRGILANRKLTVWPDLDHSAAEYRRQIDGAATLIVILAPNSPSTTNIRREVQYARQQGKAVYLVAADQVAYEWLPSWARGMVVYSLEAPDPLLTALAAPQKAPRIPFLAPVPLPDAVERPEPYTALYRLLNTARRVVLTGAPGSGKTTLAAQVCQDDALLERFPDGVLWVTIGQASDFAAKWRELYVALFGPETVPADPEEIRRHVNARLERGQFLVVLDECRGRAWRDLLHPGPSSTLLVIAIQRDAAALGEEALTLGGFANSEAAKVLASGTGLTPADVEPILGTLGTAPIVVSLASEALRRTIASPLAPAEALARLQRDLERHGVVAFDDATVSERRRSVARGVRASLALLDRADRAFLASLADCPDPVLSLPDAMHLLDLPRPRTTALLQRFHNLYFIDYDPDTQLTRWNLLYWRYFRQRPSDTKKGDPGGSRRQMSSIDRRTNPDVNRAAELLGQTTAAGPDELYALAKKLKNARYFELARDLIVLAHQSPEVQKDKARALLYVQQQALCTYKDTEAPVSERLDKALALLRAHADLDTTTNSETLGIAGGISKERWKYDGQRATLERSLGYYLRGSTAGVAADSGYTALNSAFILDVLADEESRSGTNPSTAARRQQARALREQIVAELPARAALPQHADLRSQWWFLVTLGEAYFGLGRYDEALRWLKDALLTSFSEWEYESTARQLAVLLVLAEREGSPETVLAAQETLRVFLGNDAAVVEGVRLGKVGLALSGGGFRAALFHIGVLARLAELDFLRYVEVLSCVSGGSIIGAHYYLEVRGLLSSKPDHRITRQNYIDIVKRIEREFVVGVQRNIRTRVGTNWLVNLKTALLPGYSRTNRVGELYESEIFSRVPDEGGRTRYLNRLTIMPPDEPEDFSPKVDNWRRATKAPVLVLNATTLNTGHNWQFTVSWMGEPPSSILSEVDNNDRLRRVYYWQAPAHYHDLRLGHAVAASSCVPGLFEPLALPGLYPARTVQLVDGGVQDNQGVGSLIEQECTVILVSDASGQMNSVLSPSTELVSVPLRANSILQARVREAEYLDLRAREQSSLLRGLLFVHLKKDLTVDPIAWIGDRQAPTRETPNTTSYGVDTRMQEQLSAIRTDLDSFHDTEAAALMLSGYRMTDKYFATAVPHFAPPNVVDREPWRFLEVESAMTGARSQVGPQYELQRLLAASSCRGFKAFRLSPSLAGTAVAAFLALIAALGWKVWRQGLDLQTPARVVAAVLASVVLLALVARLTRFPKSVSQFLIGLSLIPGSTLAWLHLRLFDPLYLALGQLGPDAGGARGKARTRLVVVIILVAVAAAALSGLLGR